MIFNYDFEIVEETSTFWKLDPEDLMDSYGYEDVADQFLRNCTDDVRRLIVEGLGEEINLD